MSFVSLALAQTAEEYLVRGIQKFQVGDFKGAIKDTNKAIELKPNLAVAYYIRAGAKGSLENYNGAIEDFNKVIEIDPNNAGAYYGRGTARLEIRQIRDGCLDLKRAQELGISETSNLIEEYCN